MHELCYATSKHPTHGFQYGGVIVSNADLHITSYKPAGQPMAYGSNNHGGIVQIEDDWYIFYHRHTNGTWFSRQGCAEKITFTPEGHIPQVELTSCGLNQGPLRGTGYYPAYIACNLFTDSPHLYVEDNARYPKITQDGVDGDENPGFIANMGNHATAGFKYFQCKGIQKISIVVRGYAYGHFEVRTVWNGEVLATIPVENSNVWETYSSEIHIPDGIQAIYITFIGGGNPSLAGFSLQ